MSENKSKVNIIYQIYFDDSSRDKINEKSEGLFNQNLTVFFENLVISEWFRNNEHYLKDIDYLGFLSYNFEHKNNKEIPFNEIEKLNYDIYLLGGKSVFNHNLVLFGKTSHGKYFDLLFKEMCRDVLGLNSLDLDLINMGVYQNAVVCKTEIYKKYIDECLNPCIDWCVNYRYKDILFSECNYNGGLDSRNLLIKTGFPYYTFHTFILERLWSVFIHLNEGKFNIKRF